MLLENLGKQRKHKTTSIPKKDPLQKWHSDIFNVRICPPNSLCVLRANAFATLNVDMVSVLTVCKEQKCK